MNPKETALHYMAMGWRVLPVRGKIPANKHGVLEASTEARLASVWFDKFPGRGGAVATGEPSGVWVLDIDGPEGRESLDALTGEHETLPKTTGTWAIMVPALWPSDSPQTTLAGASRTRPIRTTTFG